MRAENGRVCPQLHEVRTLLRTHTCGELRRDHVGQEVTICGWVDTYRDHGGTLFIDLRDRYGRTQVVFAPEGGADNLKSSKELRSEDVVSVTGKVADRPEGTINDKLSTGQIEVRAGKLKVLSKSLTPPFQPSMAELPARTLRLKHRYLDLRRESMQRTMFFAAIGWSSDAGLFRRIEFVDVETPVLGRSTPEGGTRLSGSQPSQQGAFYALPQSPQLYKQILMIAGYDRYVQIARCFRDEDLRADRQPSSRSWDLEMAFVDADDIIEVIDGLMARMAKEIWAKKYHWPLPRMTYDEAMERFGHDAPDLRFGMELVDVTDLAGEVEFRVFRGVADSGGKVRGINAEGAAGNYSRKGIDELTDYVKQDFGAKGLGWFKGATTASLRRRSPSNSPPICWRKSAVVSSRAGRPFAVHRRRVGSHLQGLNGLRKRLGRS